VITPKLVVPHVHMHTPLTHTKKKVENERQGMMEKMWMKNKNQIKEKNHYKSVTYVMLVGLGPLPFNDFATHPSKNTKWFVYFLYF